MRRRSKGDIVSWVLLVCCVLSLSLNLLHGSVFHLEHDHHVHQTFRKNHIQRKENPPASSRLDSGRIWIDKEHRIWADSLRTSGKKKLKGYENGETFDQLYREDRQKKGENEQQQLPLSELSCDRYGGPEDPSEMVYWRDIPQDAEYISPFRQASTSRTQYLTFEPDGGGWNNIRMSMETVIAMALIMGRTLVLPPEQKMYLLSDSTSRRQRSEFSFRDFYPMEAIAKEQKGLDIITTEEFLEREGLTGKLQNCRTGEISFPPENRTDWNGLNMEVRAELTPWLRTVGVSPPNWNPEKCVAIFPETPNSEGSASKMKELMKSALDAGRVPKWQQFIDHPTPVNATPRERLRESLAERPLVCVYDKTLQDAQVIHFSGKQSLDSRLLVLFYAFVFAENWHQDLWIKRFIRDHVRYVDEIQCAAARIVQAMRAKSSTGKFHSFHIRRGDFQYKNTRVSAEEILAISEDKLEEGSTVYVGTDERDKSFFGPLMKRYKLYFLHDFMDLIPDVNSNFYGMVDQLVVSRGERFFGCWFSTFTGYINRLRGYHSTKEKLPGYENGLLESYYYAMPENKMRMRSYYPLKRAFHSREFPISWRDIDFDVIKE